jgi:phosphopantothenoylcysteine decarboxylase
MLSADAQADPSRTPRHPATPFVSADHKLSSTDGRFRVLIITSGSVASVKLPLMVAELIKVGAAVTDRGDEVGRLT